MMRGISTRQTRLGWQVIRLHYTADEDKRPDTPQGKRWYEEAHRGVPDARWRKEYEIDYAAMGGQLVFPTFDESVHVVKRNFDVLTPDNYTIWMGADPHPRTPHAFVWLGVDKDGEKVIPWSWWPEVDDDDLMVTKDYADKLKAAFKSGLGLKPRSMVMDPAGHNFNADEHQDFFEKYRGEGLVFREGQKNLGERGEGAINEELALREFVVGNEKEQRPRLTIWDGCGDNAKLIWQMKRLRYREWKGNVTDKDPPEASQQKERHLVDALIYILLEKPRFITPGKRESTFHVINEGTGY